MYKLTDETLKNTFVNAKFRPNEKNFMTLIILKALRKKNMPKIPKIIEKTSAFLKAEGFF